MILEVLTWASTGVLAAPTPGAPPPNPAPLAPPGMQAVADLFIGWGKWVILGAGVFGLIICSGQMIVGRRNRSATAVDGAAGIPWVLGGLSLVGLAAGIVGIILPG